MLSRERPFPNPFFLGTTARRQYAVDGHNIDDALKTLLSSVSRYISQASGPFLLHGTFIISSVEPRARSIYVVDVSSRIPYNKPSTSSLFSLLWRSRSFSLLFADLYWMPASVPSSASLWAPELPDGPQRCWWSKTSSLSSCSWIIQFRLVGQPTGPSTHTHRGADRKHHQENK